MGTIMMRSCVQLGIAGVVIDGAVRDSEEIGELGLPDVRGRAPIPTARRSSCPAASNHPISIGGVTRASPATW